MSYFDNIILNSILVVLPICFYLIIILKKEKIFGVNTLISLACFTSLYFIIRFNLIIPELKNLLFINIPFIILIIYKKKFSTLFASFFIVLFYYKLFNFDLYLLIVEYMLYFVIFYILKYKDKSKEFILNTFIFIKGIVITIEFMLIMKTSTIEIFLYQFFNLLIFYLATTLIIYAIEKGEELVEYHKVLQDLEKEKVLKSALFKINHEIKNPLAVCKGYLSMINYDDTKKTEKYLNIVTSEINRALDIMDNFSKYTKIKIKKDIMDINYLIEEVISSLKIILDEKNIQVTLIGPEELLIEADYDRLKQVLINIIKNSYEAIDRNGKINIIIKNGKKYVRLYIRDNGHGIEAQDLKKLGELFYSSKEKGCGLGVALSMEIIKLHNGEMKYTSEINHGTTVMIKLPKK